MGEKLRLTPDGIPLTVNVTGELNPPVSVSVTLKLPLDPRVTVPDPGLSLRVKLGGAAIATASVTVLVTLPPFAVMVIERLPNAALAVALRVRVLALVPGARLAGEKLAVTPLGMPVALSATVAVNAGSYVSVRFTDALAPCIMLADVALSARTNAGRGVTVNCTVVVCVTLPPFAVIVIDRVPNATVKPAVSFNVAVPDPGALRDDGEKLAVMPPGSPVTLSATAALKLFVPFVVTVTDAVPPCATLAGPLVLSVRPGGGAIVTVTGKVLVRPPPVAVTVSV